MAGTNNYDIKESKKLEGLVKLKQAKDGQLKSERKRGWSDVFDEIDYSSGPGDNVYVYG